MKKILFILVLVMLSMFVFAIDGNSNNLTGTTINQNEQICELEDKRCSPEFNAIDICKNEAEIDQWVLETYCENNESCYESQCVETTCKLGDLRTSPEFNAEDKCVFFDGKIQWVLQNYYDEPTSQVCTMEYAPVCGELQVQCVKAPCPPIEKTYSNECVANAAGAKVLYKKECGDNDDLEPIGCYCTREYMPVCGEITECYDPACTVNSDGSEECEEQINCIESSNGGIICEDSTSNCKSYKKTFSNKCEANCADAKIIDDRPCENPPIQPQKELFQEAKGYCSNGEDVEIEIDYCETRSYFKEIASQKCGSMSTKCIDSTNTIDENNNTLTTDTKCVGGVVSLIDIKYEDACNPREDHDYEIEETNCEQNYEETRKIKDKCYAEGGEVIIEDYSNGCNEYKCITRQEIANTTTIQACKTISDLPEETQISCESNGGTFVTRSNNNGCLTVVDCLYKERRIMDKNEITVNKDILTNKTGLLSLALKLENLKIEFSKISTKLSSIGDYYSDTNNVDANNFYNAASLANDAVTKLDSIKELIKENVDAFSEDNAKEVRYQIAEVKENILKDILLAILG